MKLINFDGLSFVGPGSEWFWAMAQLVIVTITLFAIYRQVRAQSSANALQLVEAMNQKWDSDRMLRSRLQVVLAVRQKAGFDAIYPFLGITTFFEDLEALREERHVTTEWVWGNWGRTIQFWWQILAPSIEQGRIVEDQPTGNQAFEALNRLMRETDVKEGEKPWQPSAEFIDRRLDAMIAQITALLRMEQEAKSGSVPTGLAVTPEPSPAAGAPRQATGE